MVENREETAANTQNTIESNENENGNIYKTECEILRKKCIDLESNNQKLLKDNKMLKSLLKKYESVNMFKDIQLLKKQGEEKNMANPFEAYENIFGQDQLKTLRSTKKGQSADSKFVRILVESMWSRDEINDLSLSKQGSALAKQRKIISPSKKKVIAEMLGERVGLEDIPHIDKIQRCDRVNKLIGFALNNLRRTSTKESPSSFIAEATTTTKSFVGQNQFE